MIDYLAPAHQLSAGNHQQISSSRPLEQEGEFYILFNDNIFCFADQSVAKESLSSPKSTFTSVFLFWCIKAPNIPSDQLTAKCLKAST